LLSNRYLDIEQIIGIKDTFTNPLGKDVVSSLDDIEGIAVKVGKQWKLGIDPIQRKIHKVIDIKGRIVG